MIRQINAAIINAAERRIWRQPDGAYQVQPFWRALGVFRVDQRTRDRFVAATVGLSWAAFAMLVVSVAAIEVVPIRPWRLGLPVLAMMLVAPFIVYGVILRDCERIQPDPSFPDPARDPAAREHMLGTLRRTAWGWAVIGALILWPAYDLWMKGREGRALLAAALAALFFLVAILSWRAGRRGNG